MYRHVGPCQRAPEQVDREPVPVAQLRRHLLGSVAPEPLPVHMAHAPQEEVRDLPLLLPLIRRQDRVLEVRPVGSFGDSEDACSGQARRHLLRDALIEQPAFGEERLDANLVVLLLQRCGHLHRAVQ